MSDLTMPKKDKTNNFSDSFLRITTSNNVNNNVSFDVFYGWKSVNSR